MTITVKDGMGRDHEVHRCEGYRDCAYWAYSRYAGKWLCTQCADFAEKIGVKPDEDLDADLPEGLGADILVTLDELDAEKRRLAAKEVARLMSYGEDDRCRCEVCELTRDVALAAFQRLADGEERWR